MIVYAVTNLINGKRYIGITEGTLARRWVWHKTAARAGAKTYLHAAMRKYGPESFKTEVLAQVMPGFDRGVLCEMEKLLIAQEGTLTPKGYNMTPGGDGLPRGAENPNFGRKASAEKRQKIKAGWTDERKVEAAKTARKNFHGAETREKINASLKKQAFKDKVRASKTPERRAEAAERARVLCRQPGRREKTSATMRSDSFAEVMKKSWTPERRSAQALRMTEMRRKREDSRSGCDEQRKIS